LILINDRRADTCARLINFHVRCFKADFVVFFFVSLLWSSLNEVRNSICIHRVCGMPSISRFALL